MRALRLQAQSLASITFAIGALIGLLNTRPDLEWISYVVPGAALVFGAIRGIQSIIARRRTPVLPFEIEANTARRALGIKSHWRWLNTPKELDAFDALCKATMEDPHAYPALPTLEKRLTANRTLIFGMLGSRWKKYRLEAAFVVYPLTEGALQRFLDGTWDNSRVLEPRHIARSWSIAKAIYVAALVGRPGNSRKEVLEEMLRFIDLHDRLPILGRRGTPEGERIMSKVGMQPIRSDDGVWVLRR